MKFTGIDFETANGEVESACAVALATFEDGELVESLYWLIRPPQGFGMFWESFTACHGLTWFDVKDALEFSGIAGEILERLAAADVVVAHNASFDMRVLRRVLGHFRIEAARFRYLCTCKLARRVWPGLENYQLSTVGAHVGHTFRHHHAKDDAEAAGHALLAMMGHVGVAGAMGVAVGNFGEAECASNV